MIYWFACIYLFRFFLAGWVVLLYTPNLFCCQYLYIFSCNWPSVLLLKYCSTKTRGHAFQHRTQMYIVLHVHLSLTGLSVKTMCWRYGVSTCWLHKDSWSWAVSHAGMSMLWQWNRVSVDPEASLDRCVRWGPCLPSLCLPHRCTVSSMKYFATVTPSNVSIRIHSTEHCGVFPCSNVWNHLTCVKCCFSFIFPWGNTNQIWLTVSFHLVRNQYNKSSISCPELHLVVWSADMIHEMISLLCWRTVVMLLLDQKWTWSCESVIMQSETRRASSQA